MSGGRRKEEPPQPPLANGALKVSVWSKVLRSDAAWEDKVRWDLARAQVRGADWDSGTNGQARACPYPVRARASVWRGGVGGGRVAQRCRGELGGRGPDSRARGSPRSGLSVKPPGSRGKQRGGGTGVATRWQGVCLNGESEPNATSAFYSQ